MQHAEIVRLQHVILECERKYAAQADEMVRKDQEALCVDKIDISHGGADEYNTHYINPEKIDLKQPSLSTRRNKGSLLKTETRFTGQIPLAVWKFWFAAGGTCLNVSNFTLHIILVVAMLAQDWWVGIWAVGTYKLSQAQYVGMFAIICLIVLVGTGIRFRIFGIQVANASLKIYIGLIANLLRRPMSFFDTTPVGQILNRCGKDADDMDFTFPLTLNAFMG
jgi:ABC-type multidrug transport system fused ATPase/permease subunit